MYEAMGKQRKATRPATSSGSPTRPSGVLSKTDLQNKRHGLRESNHVLMLYLILSLTVCNLCFVILVWQEAY